MFATVIAICIGIGLAASCGFRVFLPLLVVSAASRAELLTLADGFEWLSTWLAIGALGTATVLEIGAYYLPWLDNLLDSVSAPAAVIAGIIVSAACVHDMDPLLRWSLAIIAGGGVAGVVKAGAVGIRLGSTALTGGVGNPVVATVEWIASLVLSVLAILVPILAAVVVFVLVAFLARYAARIAKGVFGHRAYDTTTGDS